MTEARRLDGIECLRGLAAFYVFFHHSVLSGLVPGSSVLHNVTRFGQAAVLIFFLISGFVVYYSTVVQKLTVSQYFKLRFRRIYPLYLVALFASWAVASILNHGLAVPNTKDLVVNLLLLQDHKNPGSFAPPFMGNLPLWSLGYEWFFYMAFLPTLWLTAKRPGLAKYLVAASSVFGLVSQVLFPNQISLFLCYYTIWWAGAEMAREYLASGLVTFRGQLVSLLSIGGMAVLWIVVAYFSPGHHGYLGYPELQVRHFLSVLAIMGVGLVWYTAGLRGYWTLLGWCRNLAPISYATYVIHMPIVLLAIGLHPLPMHWNIVWVLPVVLGLAWLMERRLQPWINRLLPVRAVRRIEHAPASATLQAHERSNA